MILKKRIIISWFAAQEIFIIIEIYIIIKVENGCAAKYFSIYLKKNRSKCIYCQFDQLNVSLLNNSLL